MLQNLMMAIGKRISERLDDLQMSRRQLLDKVNELTPQALSNLIVRDSKRSEWDEKIAEALGVSVLWLVYGKESNYQQSQTQQHCVNECENIYQFSSPQAREVNFLMNKLSPDRQDEVLRFAHERIALDESGARRSIQGAGR